MTYSQIERIENFISQIKTLKTVAGEILIMKSLVMNSKRNWKKFIL